MARCLVVGSPIVHSLSPAMHTAAYRAHGLDWSYDRLEVKAGQLANVVRDLDPQVRGLSVTAPLKHEAAALAETLSESAQMLQVANTLVPDTSGRWAGANTDISGMQAALVGAGVQRPTRVRILGAGATAITAAYAVTQLGARAIDFAVREPQRSGDAIAMAERNGAEVSVSSLNDGPRGTVDLLLSTIPISAIGGSAAAWVATTGAVFDVIYDPWPTALAAAASDAGRIVVSGLDLLAHQAADQLALMAGLQIDVAMLRAAALEQLNSSTGP